MCRHLLALMAARLEGAISCHIPAVMKTHRRICIADVGAVGGGDDSRNGGTDSPDAVAVTDTAAVTDAAAAGSPDAAADDLLRSRSSSAYSVHVAHARRWRQHGCLGAAEGCAAAVAGAADGVGLLYAAVESDGLDGGGGVAAVGVAWGCPTQVQPHSTTAAGVTGSTAVVDGGAECPGCSA